MARGAWRGALTATSGRQHPLILIPRYSTYAGPGDVASMAALTRVQAFDAKIRSGRHIPELTGALGPLGTLIGLATMEGAPPAPE